MGAEHQSHNHAPGPRSEREPTVPHDELVGSERATTLEPLPGGTEARHVLGSAAAPAFRRAAMAQLQRTHGNAFVGRLLTRSVGGALQRHPEGTPMTLDPAEAAAEIANPPPLPASGAPVAGTEVGNGETAPAGPADATPAPGETEAGTAAETAPAEIPAAAPGDPTPAPAPATPKAMDLKKAEEVLTKAYGKTKTIVPGSIVLLADREAIFKKYDEVAKGRKNPYNGNQPWVDGDAKKYIPGLDGFAEKGTVYVNEQTKLATATAHEMLHNNTAAGFRAAVGETINEGATEYLAIKALKDAGVSTASGTAYPKEVALVTKMIIIVGEDTLIKAYFGGAATLTAKFDQVQGAGEFAKMKPFAEAKNWTEADKLVTYNPKEI